MGARNRRAYILILPSLFTTGNLFCGFYALIHSYLQDFERAAYAILLAGIFDVLDGRVARITKSTSKFGVEYDSIADVVSFGVAPAFLSYAWVLKSYGQLGWVAAFFFAACGALRLARFNTIADELPKSYFIGLPIPAAADSIAATYIAYHYWNFSFAGIWILVANFLLGLLMVSSIRYRSFKDFDLRHRRSFFALVLIVIIVSSLAVRPEFSLAILFWYYVLWGPGRELIGWIRRPSDRRTERLTPHLVTSVEEVDNPTGGRK